VTAHALAQAKVEDRRVADRIAIEHQRRMGELEVAHARLQARLVQSHVELEREHPGGTRIDMGRARALAHEAREQQALLVRRLAACDRADALSGAAQAGDGLADGTLPADRTQQPSVADHRFGDATAAVRSGRGRRRPTQLRHGRRHAAERRVGEAPAVAQPAVVDLDIVACQNAHHALVAHGERDVALGGTEGADRAGVLDVPRARAEAVGP
jgi:hypothetical protein